MRKLIIAFLVCILVLPISFAQIMQLTYDSDSQSFLISPQNYNQYYRYTDFRDDATFYPNLQLEMLGSNGSVLYKDFVADVDYYKVLPGFSGFRIIQDGKTIKTQNIILCNNNNICEPCDGPGCTIAESSIVCSDCPSGSSDLFCDLVRDGICDPDCENLDADCKGCDPCYYSNMTCESVSGTFCDWGEECVGGYFDKGLADPETDRQCCRIGSCGSLLESVAIQEKTQYDSEDFNMNVSEKPAQSCSAAGGVLCNWTNECEGEWIYSIEDSMCCRGSCFDANIPVPDTPLTDAEQAKFDALNNYIITHQNNLSNETSVVPNQSQNVLLKDYEFVDSVDPERFDQDVGVSNIGNRTIKDFGVTDKVVIDKQRESELYILGFEPLTFFITLGAVVIMILLSLLFFIFKEKNKPVPAVKSGENLQPNINFLVAKGYNYQQIQNILTQKGYSTSLVNQEIRKNYYQRKQ